MTSARWHPAPEQLRAYGIGGLSLSERLAIEAHVAECEACVAVLAGSPDDGLVGLVREGLQAGPDPSISATTMALWRRPAPRPALSEVPPELHDHPRYRVLRLLGVGGMSVVYLGEHRLLKRRVAIKVLRPGTTSPDAAARFQKEVETCGRLSHPNVVSAHDAERAGSLTFLVMEYVEGTDLDELVRRNGPLSVSLACDCLRQAAQGLDHVLRHGLVHRDLKPSNLMLTPEGVVKVLDFGLARLLEGGPSSISAQGLVLGTPDYIAPEQAEGARADHRSDLYSLGCTFFFLLTGRHPYQEKGTYEKLLAHRFLSPPDPASFRPGLAEPVRELARRMLAKDPADRFQCPAEVVAAVDDLFRSGAIEPAPRRPGGPPEAVPWAGPWPWWWWWVCAAALVFLLLWATFPPVWALVPPPPWGDRWLKQHGKGPPGWDRERDRHRR
jgi:predicted Ser/Thr protein kinase